MTLEDLSQKMLDLFEAKDRARERSLHLSRRSIRESSAAIRAVHRQEEESAKEHIEEAGLALREVEELLRDHPDVRYAGFVDDALQEYAEARIVHSLIFRREISSPEEVGAGLLGYLSGLGDVTGELRRHILDLIRQGKPEEGEFFLQAMEEIYHLLMLFDYPDAITRGLRRKSDLARSMLERTRGDLANAIGRRRLEMRLEELEDKLKAADHPL
ncbi:MAG: translin family protein [Methanotrichaceae archaeon]|nr:translin family protein [Methanotrichaceae archaeon]